MEGYIFKQGIIPLLRYMTNKFVLRMFAVLVIFIVAYALRIRATLYLPVDFDEPGYLASARKYCSAVAEGHWQEIIHFERTDIHPPLAKFGFALALCSNFRVPVAPREPAVELGDPGMLICRQMAALFGALQVVVLAIISPLAAIFLSVHTCHIKYTSQVYLDYLPCLLTLVCVLCYLRYIKSSHKNLFWFAISGICLGSSVAGKYYFGICGVAVAIDWLVSEVRRDKAFSSAFGSLIRILLWGVIALSSFYACSPNLWRLSTDRSMAVVGKSVERSVKYASKSHPRIWGYRTWEPIRWLSRPVPWHYSAMPLKKSILPLQIDSLIFILAVLGFPKLWTEKRVFALWLLLGLIFLLYWPVKWPHYILLVISPFVLSAALGVNEIWGYVVQPKCRQPKH